jgi:hypothetical protein
VLFRSSEPNSTFACSLDGAAAQACTSPKAYAGLSGAQHTFSVTATDAANNADPTPATRGWTVLPDQTPPDTTITSGPAEGSSSEATTATFAFTSSEPNSTFACSLDGAAAAACTSPKTYTWLSVADHTFSVTATDAANNTDLTPATRGWTVVPDTTAPETSILSGPANPTTARSASFTFSSTESPSTFACTLDGGAPEACTSPKSYSGLGIGSHTFTVTATDASNNADLSPASATWQVNALLDDSFSSGSFTSGGWKVTSGGAGKATVESGAVTAGDLGARLVSTTAGGSVASIRKDFSGQQTLSVEWDAKVTQDKSGQSFALAKIYSSSTRVLTLSRAGGTGALSLIDASGTQALGRSLALDTVVHLKLVLQQNGANDVVTLSINGTDVPITGSTNLGSATFTGVRLGDDSKRLQLDYRIDNVLITS